MNSNHLCFCSPLKVTKRCGVHLKSAPEPSLRHVGLKTQVFFQRYFGVKGTCSERHAPQNKYVHTQVHIIDFKIFKSGLFWTFLGVQKACREKMYSNLRNAPPKRFTHSLGSKLSVLIVSRPKTHRHTFSMKKFRQKRLF